jgi:hypothetical protein
LHLSSKANLADQHVHKQDKCFSNFKKKLTNAERHQQQQDDPHAGFYLFRSLLAAEAR